jgi:hypothetical protein
MKKLFTFLFLVLSVMAFASPVNKNNAERIAVNYYRHFAPAQITDFSVSNVSEARYNGLLTYYTFAFRSGGFVMVAADDASIPVLGSSYEGVFSGESINPEAKAWFDSYSSQISAIVSANLDNSATRPEWDKLLSNHFDKGVMDINPLILTTWDQGCYYNALCPTEPAAGTGSCNHAWTGCVATAMSQIMKYHGFPANGLNSHSYTHETYGLQTANFAAANFVYTSMPNNVTSSNAEVSRLMYYAGVSVNMGYGADGSGAYSTDVPFALVNFFNYSPTTSYAEMASYTATNWKNLLIAELTANRPVYYSGSSTASGGHAWVCDGYRTSDSKFHFNWGWSGSGNGYYAIGALNPLGNNFNDANAIVYGITPGNNLFSWVIQNSAFTAASRGIGYISAVDANIAWATAYDGSGGAAVVNEISHTTNGGTTWIAGQVLGGSTYGIGNISAISATTAWVSVYNGVGNQDNTCGVYKTTNGGTSWVHQATALVGSASFANNVYFWDANNGMCHGDVKDGYFEIYTTNNGGTTWTRVPQANITGGTPASGEGGWTSVIEAVGDNTIMFGTNKSKIYISDDKGLHWRISSTGITPATNGGINIIAFTDINNGLAVQTVAPITMKRTNDAGLTWTTVTPTGAFLTSDICAVPGAANTYVSTGAATGATGASYSFDGGSSWTYFGGTNAKQFLAADFVSNTCGWAGGFNENQYNSGMYKMTGVLGSGVTPSLAVTPPSQNVTAPAGATAFTVTASGAWNAVSDATWCTVTASGTGNGTLTATYTENLAATPRTANITVTLAGASPVIVTVVQAGAAPSLTVSPLNQNVTAPAGTTPFTVTTTAVWSASSDATWCTVTPSGTGNGTLTATYTENTTFSTRIANITVTSTGLTPVVVTVTQAAANATLAVTPSNQDVTAPAGTTNFSITSSGTWSVVSNSFWCTIVTPSGTGNGTLVANYTENTTTTSRVATITVSAAGTSSINVTVTQAGATTTLSVTPPNQDVTAAAGTTAFDVVTNSTWTASSSATWCLVTNSGSGNGQLTANYTENTTASLRTALITVSASGASPVTVTVSQQGATATLAVTPANQNVPATSGSVNFTATSSTNWLATSDAAWCTVTPSGTGNGTITANYTTNPAATSRIAHITVTVAGITPVIVTVTQDFVDGIQDPSQNGFAIYPNPSTGLITVTSQLVENAGNGTVNFELCDLTGKVIYSKQLTQNLTTMDLSGIMKGVYVARLVSRMGVATRKLIVK